MLSPDLGQATSRQKITFLKVFFRMLGFEKDMPKDHAMQAQRGDKLKKIKVFKPAALF